jgi:DNA polymerase-3 subunit alpha
MYIIFDTETTGLPRDFRAPITDTDNWPRLVQLAWQIHDIKGDLVEVKNYIIKPEGYTIPYNAEKIHGISTERAIRQGVELSWVLEEFNKALEKSTFAVGHNVIFDVNIVGCEFYRKGISSTMTSFPQIDTKNESVEYCAIPGGKGGKYKWPTLTELHEKLFNEAFGEAHNASADVEATARCFLELVRLNVIGSDRLDISPEDYQTFKDNNPSEIKAIGLNIQPYTPDDVEFEEVGDQKKGSELSKADLQKNLESLKDVAFSHLHNHSQFSVLQATTTIKELVHHASENGMPAVALTDTGNLMAAFHFTKEAANYNKSVESKNQELIDKGEEPKYIPLKPIIGCELYVCKDHTNKKVKDNGSQVTFLAKNKNGYHNLSKMSSISFVDGFYYVPRIDRTVVEQYKEDLIVLTGNIYGEIPNLILNVGEQQAEEAFLWWKEQFGDDFYVELNRHGLDTEDKVNEVLLRFAKKHGVKCIAANSSYYTKKEEHNAHDILLCIKDGERQSAPIGKGRGFRYGLETQEYYMKSPEQMKELFKDIPEAIINTSEIADKCTGYVLARDVLLPAFDIPEQFIDPQDNEDGGKRGENAFLRHLTYEGAIKRYEEITDEIKERLDFELATIEKTGYPGYFLIVQDFTSKAREMGVSVGPGRGSAAGSAVAYCIGITNVDPIEYDLLFERFLNPDRVSLPDIDIDFDDEGREKVINFVINKYGANQVAQIITYGKMAAKSAIRDTARVLDLPLSDADRLAKLVPDISLKKMFNWSDEQLKGKLNPDQLDMVNQLKNINAGSGLPSETMQQAQVIEGSVRNTGIHACGVIITPDDITQFVPVSLAKDSNMYVTQFDNSVVEDAGLLKMDFLGLKTLTIIKTAIKLVKERHGVEIDPDEIPLDDTKTYELYQRGETNGTFQFESAGMQKHLRSLKPDTFADLIAMNALYRPGPLEYIPNFIARKHGREEIVYDLDIMEEYLAETYGITVYQEQVMRLSQSIAGFSKGDADVLRKAMGKKIMALLAKLKPKFIDGGKNNGHDPKKLEKIWNDWEAFAAYAFNKSHSTCYSVVAYQTGYLKAHYPAEYMAAVLTHNMSDIKKVTFFMEECKRMGIKVLGPDINESALRFRVNDRGEVRFGMGAIKGVGGAAVEVIVKERNENGPFGNIFDLTKRIDLKSVNKRTMENLALGGAFDSFEGEHRAMYFYEENSDQTFLAKAMKFGSAYQQMKDAPPDLFGNSSMDTITEPKLPPAQEWESLYALSKERDVVGVYLSGHPLDAYKHEIKHFCKGNSLSQLENPKDLMGKSLNIAGIISAAQQRITKTGKPFGIITLEDYSGSKEFFLFGNDFNKVKDYMVQGAYVFARISVQPGKWDKEKIDFNFVTVHFLSEVMEKMCKGLRLKIDVDDISENFLVKISKLVEENEGRHPLKFDLYELGNKSRIAMMSRKKKVEITGEFLDKLAEFSELELQLE